MSKREYLISGFHDEEAKKVDSFLQKLLHHLIEGQFLVIGGLAIRYRLNEHGIAYPIRGFNDLDLKAFSIDTVKTSVQKDFLIYHYHPMKNNSFYVVLADRETGIKVDIFDSTIRDERYTTVPFHSWNLKIVEVEDQLVKTVYDTQRISEENKVDPKQFSDTILLSQIANMTLANEIWQSRNYHSYPNSIYKAIDKSSKIAFEHPEWVKEKPFRKSKPYKCLKCENANGFVVSPMEDVYKILKNYVE